MRKKKLQKVAAMLICAILTLTMITPVVAYAASLIEHDGNEKSWGGVPSGYLYTGAYTTSHVNGLAYRVVGVNATTSVCKQQFAIDYVVNNGFNGTTSKQEANDLMLVMPLIGGSKYNVYLTVEGKFGLYGDVNGTTEDSVLWVPQNTNPVDPSDSAQTKYEKYLSYLIDGVALPVGMEGSTFEDGVFDYLFEKWATHTSNEVMYADYLTNKNCEGSRTYYVIELYYLSGAKSNSTDQNGQTYALMGSAKSLAKFYGELSDMIWERSGIYASSGDYSTMLQSLLGSYVDNEDANDLLQLQGAFASLALATRSTKGRFCGGEAPNRYGVGVIVPYTNSGRPGATTSIVPQDFTLRVIDDGSISYETSIGYAYRNVTLSVENNAFMQSLLSAARHSSMSIEEQEQIKNIELTIKVSSTSPGAFVGGWELYGSAVENILQDNYLYPIVQDRVENTSIDGYKDGIPYISLAHGEREAVGYEQHISPTALCFGSGTTAVQRYRNNAVYKYLFPATNEDAWDLSGDFRSKLGNVSYTDILNANHYVQSGVQYYDKWNFVCPSGYEVVDYVLTSLRGDTWISIPKVWVTSAVVLRNIGNGQLYIFDLITDTTNYNFGTNCDTLDADLVEPATLTPICTYHRLLRDDGTVSWWNPTDVNRTSLAYDLSAKKEAQCSPNNVTWGYPDAHGADGTTYEFRWNFSVDEFQDFLSGSSIKCNLQYSGTADWSFDATIRIKDNKGLNLGAVNSGIPNADILRNGVMSGKANLTSTVQSLPISKWQFATPTTPKVYAEIKQGDYGAEDFDVMSGVPTTENLWVGVGADQYRLSLSGSIIVVGSQKSKNSSDTSANAWHINSTTTLNSPRGGVNMTLPDTKGSYDSTHANLWNGEYGQILKTTVTSDDYTVGTSTWDESGKYAKDVLGTPESNSAIYRVTVIDGIIAGFWGNNKPCTLSCPTHVVGGESGSAGEKKEAEGWGGTATAAGGTCSLCGKTIEAKTAQNPPAPTNPSDPDYGADKPSSNAVADNTHECDYKFVFDCSTGILTFESSESGSINFGPVGEINEYDQSYNLNVTCTATHGSISYSNESYTRDDLIDDGWTVATSHGCACSLETNMNHPAGCPWEYYIYETYDMYVTQTLENWQIMSLVGAEVTNMDETLFYDTVNAANAKQYGYKNSSTSEGTAYYAVGSVPFGSRIWKTGVLYNGWTKKLDGEAPTCFGKEELLQSFGEDSSWYEKRNGRIIFSGGHTMYGWDGMDDTMDSECKLHSQDTESRVQCVYHTGLNAKLAELGHRTTNYWQDLLGDQRIELCVAYDSYILKTYYMGNQVHADPQNYLSQARNSRGITDNRSLAFDTWAGNVHYSEEGDQECWAYRSRSDHMSDGIYYTGDIQTPGAPNHTSTAVQAYVTDAVNYYCRSNGYENGQPGGRQYAYSAYCISDTVEVGYMEQSAYFTDSVIKENQMIIEDGYRIGNSLNIFNCDFTGPGQANVYNHYSQFSVDEIKYSMVNAWIGDTNNPLAGASRRHIDNVGNYMYSSGYVGSQAQPKYGNKDTVFESVTMMTLRGQYLRRDDNIAVFGIAGADEGIDGYLQPGGGGEYGEGFRSGYYVECYTNQGTSRDIQSPSMYKYGMTNIVFLDNADSTKRWSEAGYWSNYPRQGNGYQFSSANISNATIGTKVLNGSPMTVWETKTHSNDFELSLWNKVEWGPGPYYKYEGETEYDRYVAFLSGEGPGSPWQYRYTAAMTGNTQYQKYGTGQINFYASDSGTMNAMRFSKQAYAIIDGIKMWPYAPNGVYSNPVEVQASYTTFNSYTGTDFEGGYKLIPLNNLNVKFNGKYTDSYINENGSDCSDPAVAVVNDIVVHNPVSTEYSTVISNGVTNVSSSEISGFIDESGQDMRYGPSTIWDGTKYVNYEDLAEDRKLDYWVIGNTCNIWVSDLGDFKSNSAEKTTDLVSPTTKTGVNSGILGTTYDSSGKLHINNNGLRDEKVNTLSINSSEMGGKGYADRMLTSQWIYGRYVKFPCAVTFESGGNVYVVEKDTWLDLNTCTPTSTGGMSTVASGLSLIPSSLKGANENDMNLFIPSVVSGGTYWYGNLRKPIDPQVPGMISCTSYKNFYNGAGKPYNGANDKQFDYGLNYTFRILGSAEECIQGTVEFYSMAINDSVNYKKIANGQTITSGDVQKSVDALKFKEASNISRTPTMGSSSSSISTISTFVPGLAENSYRPAYRDGYMADSGAYNYCKIDIVGRIGNLALEDVADFRYSNLFKQVTPDGSWLIEGVIRNTDPTMPLTIGAEPIDIYGYNVGSEMKATDKVTDVIVSHSVYNISRYTGTSSAYRNVNAGKYDAYSGKNWFSLPLTPGKNNLDEYKTQSVKLGYDAFFDIETIGNYYGNNLTDEGPDHWDTTKANLGDSRKQVMTIIPHYLLYDYTTGEFVDDIKIWYGEQNNYTLCYDGNVGAANIVKDGGVPINDITSGLYQDVMKESDRRNVSGKNQYQNTNGSYTSESGLTKAVTLLTAPANNFATNALNSGTRWIGNSSRIVLDGYDRNFIGSWYFYQKRDGSGFDATFGTIMTQPNSDGPARNTWLAHVGYGVTDVDFATQSQRWFFKLALPSSSFISTSTFKDINDGGAVKPIIDGNTIRQDGIVYSHEQLKEEHPNSVLICYLDIKVKGEIYTLRYKGLHNGDGNEIFDPDTPDKPGKPENPPEDPDNPWTPPFNKIPEPDPNPDPSDPDKPGPEPEWEPVITFDPWDNSSTDLAVYGTH